MNMESKPPSSPVSIDVVAPVQAPAPLLSMDSAWNEIAGRMKRGDTKALAELYDGTSAVVYGMMLRILGDTAAAQETLVEAYAHAWSRIHTFDPARSGLVAWLILLARRIALDRPDRKPPQAFVPTTGDRQTLERAFFDGVKEEDLRGALTRLREEKKGEGK